MKVEFKLQVTELKAVSAGDFSEESPFVIKNITDENVTLEVLPVNNSGVYVSTVLTPGWNPEICIGVKAVPADTLQIGR